ncbi:MAG: DUF2380 domain-containing protein [Nitrospiraceae bacterium]|nr:DUF2380 domain-containing protein [Nitrospiraceae bacterium]
MRTTAIQSNRNRIIRHLMIQTVLTRLLLVSYALQRRQSFTYSDDFPEGKLYECTNGNCTKYIFAGSGRIASKTSSNTYYYHTDHLGNSSIITDAAGNKVEEIYYYPFGGTRLNQGSVNVKHKYTGQEEDPETGLYYYNARYYDPILGRFISADSIVQDPFDPQAFNRYSYTRNNPLIYIDPTGNWWDTYYSYGDWGGGCYWCNYDPWAGSSRSQQEAYWDRVASNTSSSSPSSSSSTSTSSSSSTPTPTPSPAPTPASSTQIYSSNYSSNYSPVVNLPRTAEYFGEGGNLLTEIYAPIKKKLVDRAISKFQEGHDLAGFIDTLGIAAIDVFLPQSAYEVPLLFIGNVKVVKHAHHLLPRQFGAYFKAAGLNINEQKLLRDLDVEFHKIIHGKGGGEAWQNSWNMQWGRFFEGTMPGEKTKDEILEELKRLMSEKGIE